MLRPCSQAVITCPAPSSAVAPLLALTYTPTVLTTAPDCDSRTLFPTTSPSSTYAGSCPT